MFGHQSEHLIWAPDRRDDLPFTLFAMAEQEKMDLKDELKSALYNGTIDRCSSFDEFVARINENNTYNEFSDSDWEDIYEVWSF